MNISTGLILFDSVQFQDEVFFVVTFWIFAEANSLEILQKTVLCYVKYVMVMEYIGIVNETAKKCVSL